MNLLEPILDLRSRLVWTDLFELLLIGAAVYAMMRFLRGTRGARLLRGFLLLLVGGTVVVNLFAEVFGLERIQVLYWPAVGALLLAALVAFQPELRRALIRLGGATWFAETSLQMDHVIDAVVESVGYLSKNKIGALIAFERTTELGGLIESGCRLDAEVTRELLMTIFWPGTALHDMGVIIAQERLAAAAVQFPLTESEEADTTLGSRHRAALGLSEETGALVVVVSEETGTISAVQNGTLHRHLSPEALKHRLRSELTRAAPEKK